MLVLYIEIEVQRLCGNDVCVPLTFSLSKTFSVESVWCSGVSEPGTLYKAVIKTKE